MTRLPAARRTLFMHPAHRTVGVAGGGISHRPYCRGEKYPTDCEAVTPRRLALAAHRQDTDACAALRLFESAISGRLDVRCQRVDLDALDQDRSGLADADCVVVFGQGVCMARRWADIPRECVPHQVEKCSLTVKIAAAAAWHPVLDGVEPFTALQDGYPPAQVPLDATVLLIGETLSGSGPVAWIGHRQGRVFCTTLGSADDFRQPDFVRLTINAADWIAR
jgi:hypothetical protein